MLKRTQKLRRDIDESLARELVERIKVNKKIRRSLKPVGRIHIDRKLPFLCVYRKPSSQNGIADGDEKLVMGEASYLIAPAEEEFHDKTSFLVMEIARTLADQFGAFLLIEVWTKPITTTADMPASPSRFKIHPPPLDYPQINNEVLLESLKKIRVQKQPAVVTYSRVMRHHPRDLKPIISAKEAEENNIHCVGIEVGDIYRDSNTMADFPRLRAQIWRGLSRSIKRLVFDFVQQKSTFRPPHYHALGKKSLVKTVWSIDEQLAAISQQLDLVLMATPTNTKEAYEEFKKRHFEKQPKFLYRPLSINPGDLKRQLYSINIDKIEDPAMAQLFQLQQRGLDNKISLMADRNTSRFIYGSLQLYGPIEEYHVELSRFILNNVKRHKAEKGEKPDLVSAPEFAEYAERELEYYRNLVPAFDGKVEIRDDIPGVLVSGDTLMISDYVKINRKRVGAVLQHEVGTHMLTYFNGQAQPFKQLQTGLIGYDELQEGLAVLAEVLHQGLSSTRLRTLAARVLITKMLIDGVSFIEAFRELTSRYNFPRQTAFKIVTRVYRGGGLTKDSVYLRGLIWLLDYFRKGGEPDILYIGKYPIPFMPFIKEMMWRNVIKPPMVLPRYLTQDDADTGLTVLKEGISIEDLCSKVSD